MDPQDKTPSTRLGDDDGPNKLLVALGALGIALVLTWAVATLFEIAFAKALAAVIIGLFCVLVALLMAGIT